MKKKANHQANIVRITEVIKHPNADSLEIIPIGEYQVVSRIGQFKVGDLGVYIQPDSVVPQTEPFKFIWGPYMCIPPSENVSSDPNESIVPEKRRRITVRKFRGEWSEGLLLPVTDFKELLTATLIVYLSKPNTSLADVINAFPFKENDDVSDILGITHYDPDAGKEAQSDNIKAPKVRSHYPKSLRGWVKFMWRRVKNLFGVYDAVGGAEAGVSLGIGVYDVDAFKNYPNTFENGEPVIVTEKIHGSNARYVYLDGTMYAGSRTLWKSPNSNCIWRKALKELPWIEEWCRAHKGYILRGEVTPTQGKFNYGSDKVQFFVFDVQKSNGEYVWDSDEADMELLARLEDKWVPVLYRGKFDLAHIKSLVDGPSTVPNAKHIREGVVVKTMKERHVRGLGRAQLKIVSNTYLERDNK